MTTFSNRPPADVPGLLRALLADDPGRPRLTWYGPDGERVELSAKVLDNWVAKTANLLTEELDAGPGTRVAVHLPTHWRTVVWLLACWSCGAHVLVPDRAGAGPHGSPPESTSQGPLGPDDLLVAADAGLLAALGSGPRAPQAVAVALGALAGTFGPGLPDGAVDAAAEVRLYGDVFLPPVRPADGDPALTVGSAAPVPHGALLDAARAAAPATWPDAVRLLTGAGPDRAVAGWLAPLVRGGSLVLHHDLAGLPTDASLRLSTQEGVGARLD